MAIGNPLGMQSSVTSGIISAVNRTITSTDGNTYNLIQTDAAINSGNSGGALVNGEGKVIGINTLKLNGTGVEGMGFAIPIDSAKPIFEQLISDGKVVRPNIGLTGRDLNEQTAKANKLVEGVYVVSVEPFCAAEKAVIKPGDVIIEIQGKSIKTMDELKERGMWFACADMDGEVIYRQNLTGSIGLVIGNEGSGVSRLVKEKCDFISSIPMKGDIDSLNASVAAGVLAFEVVRQRLGK